VSLKVLRLSRPSLSIQHPLPTSFTSHKPCTPSPPTSASCAYPCVDPSTSNFILSPVLALPPAFGSTYVGETFSCTLCANNELVPGSTAARTISNVRIEAEIKIPSSGVPIALQLSPEGGTAENGQALVPGADLEPGKSSQKVVNFDLKEEGSHVLAVTVTYSETTPTSGRVRNFKKLYQFMCKGCMVVRTKTGSLPVQKHKGRKWALEAQLENCGEDSITLNMVLLETREGFRSQGINWEIVGDGAEMERPILMPGDVQQVCFLVEEYLSEGGRNQEAGADGRLVFGVLSLSWRGPMGKRGFLTTGGLGAKMT